MVEKNSSDAHLTLDSLLSVRDAAQLTNLSVPTFYTERNKKLLGFDERDEASAVWLISVGRLVEAGFLMPDLTPAKTLRRYATSLQPNNDSVHEQTLDEMRKRLDNLEREVEGLRRERDNLQLIADERAKQLELINALITNMGVRADEERG